MKKYRPYRAGFIVIYVLGLLCTVDAVYTLISQLRGTQDSYTSSFALFSYLIFLLAFFYVKMYVSARVEIDDKVLRVVCPIYIKPAPGAKRASFIYRQGETDMVLMNKRFLLSELEQYGYIEDLKIAQLDKSAAGPKNKLFPVHEVAFVLKDGTKVHLNAGYYSKKQLSGMVEQIRAITGIEPSGSFAQAVAA